ncbi:hypothetical protein [Nonomuraea sp. NPDC049695]|uniref:hypothetical protein n=1 Tax=Nonomuraea sp. NPDC049695 TaxID=3154734 RepID=UPI003416C8AA
MSVSLSLSSLKNEYGRDWTISDAVSGGWYAVRRVLLPDQGNERGLSNDATRRSRSG